MSAAHPGGGTILVLGGTGMLGRAVVEQARHRGRACVGAARSGADVALDLGDAARIAAVMRQLAPDRVINCAALTDIGACEDDPLTAWRINARAVALVADACRATGAQLVQVSTDHYFSGDGAAPHDEAAPVRLLNDYCRTKYAGEAFALTVPDALVVRTNIVGFRGRGRPSFGEWAVAAIRGDLPVTLFDDAFVSSIDCRACARALLDLADSGAAGLVNVGAREIFSKRMFVERLAAALGLTMTRARPGSVRSLPVARGDSLGMDVRKAEAILGYRLPMLDEVIAALAAELPDIV